MAIAAVISLLQTLELRNPELFHDQTVNTLESLRATAEYILNVLEKLRESRFDPKKMKYLEGKIRVAASDAQDAVEVKIYQIVKGCSWTFGILQHQDLLPIVEKMDTTKKKLTKFFSDFSTSSTHDDDQILQLSEDSLIGTSNPMLSNLENDEIMQGLDDELEMIVKKLTGPPSDLDIVAISGMGGIGKTTLATKAYDHLPIRYHFDILAWVTISQEFRCRSVLLEALHCISKQTNIINEKDYPNKDDSELADLVQKNLKGRRYLVVVDDIWSIDVWDSIRGIFPNCHNRSRIILTTRETKVAMYANTSSPHEMNLLNVENGWKLLRNKVFGPKHDHPPELEEIGKKIVEKCQGLPLTISVIGGHLSKMTKTLESWKDVAQTLGEIVANHPDKCLGVLGLSYHHLPIHLKPCFLFMGSFPEDFRVASRRLIQLWIAEGLIRMSTGRKSLEEVAEDYLEDLIGRNLIMARKRSLNGEIKTCAMHDLLREFCLIEAKTTKFMHVERTDRTPPTQKHNFRRFSFQTESYYSADMWCMLLPVISTSVYLFSPLTPTYEIPVKILWIWPIYFVIHDFFSRFNLLRVLAIFDEFVCFHPPNFPQVITKLFHLRYLQVGYYGNIPASISKLQNLQTLITHRRENSKTTLPREVWMMKNLRHIHLGGPTYLPIPRRESILNKQRMIGMPNLEELSELFSSCCTNEVFSATPNLKRLIVRMTTSANRLIDMSSLTKLQELKCTSNRLFCYSIKSYVFPTSLKRLTVTDCFWFDWDDISTLVMLPNLEELKLKVAVVYGDQVWRLSDEDKFQSLKLLLFKDINLERWEASSDSFPNLRRLVLKNCNYLKEIPTNFGEVCTLESIELHNCSSLAEDSARNIEQEQEDMGNNSLKVYIHNSRRK